jgi:hypothetical protein
MPTDDKKREIRELKREIKKAGNRKRRQQLKRQLQENPGEAADADVDVGRYRSAEYNGLDNDATRRRKDKKDEEE